MRQDLRDKVLMRFDELAKWVGDEDFEDSVQHVLRTLVVFQEWVLKMKTRDDLKKFLDDMPEPSRTEEKLLLGTLRYLPLIVRVWIKRLAKIAYKKIPAPPSGRPGTDLRIRARVSAYVGKLHTEGYALEVSKKSAARKFALSEGTVQRIWDDRGSIDEADFRSAFNWLSSQ